MSDVPVLIVGGGPSGLAAAIELGRRGIEVCVVEPRTTLDPLRARDHQCADDGAPPPVGDRRRLREAAPLPVAYAQDVVFCTHLLGHEITRFPGAFGLTVERRDEYAESGQQAPQPVVEQVLRDAAAALPTVTVLLGSRVTRVVDGSDDVRAEMQHPTGVVQEIVADWLLGFDGSGGVTRRAIGARYEGLSGMLPNVSITFRAPELDRQTLCAHGIHYWVIGAERGGLMGRLDLDGIWWAIVQGVDAIAEDIDAAALVRSVVGADIDVEVLAIDPWSARMLLVDHYRGQRTFLVGDAAHLNPPWGGHGFNTCVGDAVNIGWKLAAVLQGWAPPSLLDTYEIERRPVAERTIAAAANQEAFLAPSFATADLDADDDAGIQLRAELARRLEVKHSEFHSLGLVLGYDYRDSSVVVADGQLLPEPKLDTFVPSAHPGARLPHAWLPDGSSIYDHLDEGFTLLRMSPHRDATPLLDAAQRQSVPLTLLDLSFTPQLRQSYGADLLLIRPDQHIAWRGSRIEDPDVLVTRVIASRPTEEER